MDDILKIRAYHISEQSYVKIVELGFKSNGDIQYLIFTKPKNIDNTQCQYICSGEDINDFIFEPCTGLRDEKGNLIYEGDILKGTYYINNPVIDYYPVDRGEGEWLNGNEDIPLSAYNDLSVVVGNIHENSDLLEDK